MFRLWRVSRHPTKTIITRFSSISYLPVHDFWLNFDWTFRPHKWNVFMLTKCVWGMGMLHMVFNTEAGNYYSKPAFIMSLIKQEKLAFIGYFIHSVFMYLCVLTNKITGIRRFPISGISPGSQNNQTSEHIFTFMTQWGYGCIYRHFDKRV